MLRKCVVLIGFGVGVLAQTTPSIQGTVLDPSGAVVPEATVTLKRGAKSIEPPVRTGSAGDFRFDAVAEGTYSLEVMHEGFKLSITQLRVAARRMAPLRIELAIAAVSSEIAVGRPMPFPCRPRLPRTVIRPRWI